MTTLDDKLLGEKVHYYCSSSEDEDDEHESSKDPTPKFIPSNELSKGDGTTANTGPKGVIKDWQRYKQLEAERREEQENEKLALMKKLSLTCQSANDEQKMLEQEQQLDLELQELLDDKILEEFKQLHMQQMMELHHKDRRYGFLYELNSGQEYLDAVDKTEKSTLVIIYIFCEGQKDCKLMNECLQKLAVDYPEVKFCSVDASIAGLSGHFKKKGVPALLIYRNGGLVGNFVRISDELGDEFVTSDVENYLLEHGMLPDHSAIFTALRMAHGDSSDD